MIHSRVVRSLFYAWTALTGLFVLAPLLVVFINSLGVERYVAFPPQHLSLVWYRALPSWFWPSTVYSLELAAVAIVVGTMLAVPAAISMVRGVVPGKAVIDALLRSPLQIPLVISGVAFLSYFDLVRRATGLGLAGTFVGLCIAHTIVVSPYVLVAVVAQLAKYDNALDEAAYGMGASVWTSFWRITFPLIRPSIVAGAFFAFLMSFDNVPVSIFLIPAGRSTLAIDLFQSTVQDLSRAQYAVGTLVTLAATALILVAQRYLGIMPLLRERR